MSVTDVEIPAALDGERIDRVIALLTGRSRSVVTELVADGSVKLAGRPVSSRHERVHAGERLEFELGAPEGGGAVAVVPEDVPFRVVYEDGDLIVVDKPAGLVVHPGSGHRGGTLASGLVARFPDLAEAALAGAGDPSRPGIVHRLDKDTSGLLVVGRRPASFAALSAQLADRTMGRTYVALALGAVESDSGSIDAPIGRSERDRTRMAVTVDGRPARTRYRVVRRLESPAVATLLDVELETGRTHQIRVHLAAIGHPVAGDTRYRGGLPEGVRSLTGLRRPFLHAGKLRLVHPTNGVETEWESPLPGDLAEVLARFH